MIWYLIGWIVMGLWGADFIIGVILGLKLMIKGYFMDFDKISDYVIRSGMDRLDDDVFCKFAHKNIVTCIIWAVFHSMTWPVELLRTIYLDIPDAIEYYEAQHDEKEAA